MKPKTIENPYCIAHSGGTISAGFDFNGFRYHVWLNDDASVQGGILYCNPPLGTERHGPGSFNTRKLDAKAKANAPLVAQLLAAIDVAAAREEFRARQQGKIEKRSAEHRAHIQRELFADHGQTMLDAIKLAEGYLEGRELVPAISVANALRAVIALVKVPS